MHLHNYGQAKHSVFSTNFLLEQLNLEGEWEVAILETS